jgi:hypothetical protein
MPLGAKRNVDPTIECGVTLEPVLSKAMIWLSREPYEPKLTRGNRRRFVVAKDSHKRYLRPAGHRLVLPLARDTPRRETAPCGHNASGRPTFARPRGLLGVLPRTVVRESNPLLPDSVSGALPLSYPLGHWGRHSLRQKPFTEHTASTAYWVDTGRSAPLEPAESTLLESPF